MNATEWIMKSGGYKGTTNCDLVMASGHFTTSHLPHNFDKWTDKQEEEWFEENAWEPLEYWRVKDVWGNIETLANEVASNGGTNHLCDKCKAERSKNE